MQHWFCPAVCLAVTMMSTQALAQTPPPDPVPESTQEQSSPPEYPTIRIGFLGYFQYAAELKNRDSFNAFDVTRGYINVTGRLAEHVRFRITPDVKRESGGGLDGSLVFRMKYAFVEFDGLRQGAWLRMGAHHTPWLDFAEHVNRYRVQGTVFAEREGTIPGSSDFGVGYLTPLPDEYGEVQFGVYNGEGFTQPESTKHKSLQGRLTIRPFPNAGLLHPLRLSAYYNWGWFDADRPRRHGIVMAHYEHEKLVASFEWLGATERPTADAASDLERRGYSGFLEVRQGLEGWAPWVRFDHFDPEVGAPNNSRRRLITALAYWLRWSDSRVGFVLSDEDERFDDGRPDLNRILAQVHLEF